MSAFIVDRGHIAYLVQAGKVWNTPRTPVTWGRYHNFGLSGGSAKTQRTPAEVGQMLWDENIRSIQYRYPDTKENLDNAPGPCGESFRYSDHRVPRNVPFVDPVQVVKACDCFSYQSCETDDWELSEAYTYIEALKRHAMRRLPGSEEAEWGAPKAWVEFFRLPVEDTPTR